MFNSTPLHDSCKTTNIEIFILLLQNSIKLFSLVNSNHQTPLHCLVFNNNVNAIKIIKENDVFFESAKNNINEKDSTLKSPLEYACSDNKLEMVKILIETFDNIDLNGDDNDDYSPLYYACESNAVDIVSFLLQQEKINVNRQNGYSKITALNFACDKNYNEIVSIILQHSNIDVNLSDCDGKTALHSAIEQKNEENVKMLLDEKLNININSIDKYRKASPLHYACESCNLNIIQMLFNYSDVQSKKLIENQQENIEENHFVSLIQINCKDKQNRTPLHVAVNSNFFDCVDLLLKQPGIEINAIDSNKIVPLHLACKNKNIEIVKLLVSQNDIDINAQDSSGFTPLHYACESGIEEIVRILLSKDGILTDVEDQIYN